jgi:uncharacterized membrane protein
VLKDVTWERLEHGNELKTGGRVYFLDGVRMRHVEGRRSAHAEYTEDGIVRPGSKIRIWAAGKETELWVGLVHALEQRAAGTAGDNLLLDGVDATGEEVADVQLSQALAGPIDSHGELELPHGFDKRLADIKLNSELNASLHVYKAPAHGPPTLNADDGSESETCVTTMSSRAGGTKSIRMPNTRSSKRVRTKPEERSSPARNENDERLQKEVKKLHDAVADLRRDLAAEKRKSMDLAKELRAAKQQARSALEAAEEATEKASAALDAAKDARNNIEGERAFILEFAKTFHSDSGAAQ